MLHQVILKKIENIIYVFTDPISSQLQTLTEFLRNDINNCSRYQRIKELLELEEYKGGFDATFFNIKNNIIYLEHSYWEELPEFTTTRSNMIKILNDWHSVWKQRPPFIKVTMDENQNVIFTPLNEYKEKEEKA